MHQDKEDEVIKKLCESLLKRYQIGLETSVSSNIFIFNSVDLLHYKCHKINLKRGGS